jgi:flagellar basal-body rod modification protein FlgD
MTVASITSPQSQPFGSLASVAQNAASGVSGTPASGTSASGTSASGTSASGSAAGTGASASASNTALSSLTGNFQDFLSLLMTQLQNQDPSSPMDTNQFTSELVEFASVSQQINTNASLTQLIQLTQDGQMINSSTLVGKQVSVQSNQMPLQNSSAELQFTSTTAAPAVVAVYNAAGTEVAQANLNATVGINTWTWDGSLAGGGTAPDGAYTVAVAGTDASGKSVTLPYTVVGTATGVVTNGNSLELQMGSETVDFSTIKSVLN